MIYGIMQESAMKGIEVNDKDKNQHRRERRFLWDGTSETIGKFKLLKNRKNLKICVDKNLDFFK